MIAFMAALPGRHGRQRNLRGLAGLLLLSVLLPLGACATNPVTGGTGLPPLSSLEEEARAGAEAHPKILKAYGGAYEDDRVGAYVAGVTTRIARVAGNPNVSYRVTVLNSPIINAFALPGGYVYVTRGLLALANDEAELAGVIGHEIAHVTARHSSQRQTATLGANILGAVLGAVVGSSAINQVFSAGSQGLLASYSRDQEYEADLLGVKALAGAGYDPMAAADFLQVMQAQAELAAREAQRAYDGTRVDWLATHPATADRVSVARSQAEKVASGRGERNRDIYLRAIDGLLYGDSPDAGFVRGRQFAHPELKFAFTVPEGFRLSNAPEAVWAQGPDKVLVKFDGAAKESATPIAAYLHDVWASDVRVDDLRVGTVNGLPAASGWTLLQGYRTRIVAIEFSPTQVYRFLIGTPRQVGTRYDAPLDEMVRSFHRISGRELADLKPWRLRIVSARAGQSAATLAAQTPFSTFAVERFRVLNGLIPGQDVQAGQAYKLIVD